MELASELVRSCMRAFYDTKHTLVIDSLIIHSLLRDDDMAYLMGMNTKELHKLCGRLREDRFLAVHTRPETKEGQQRPMNRTYYYIDYRATIDAIKWRVYLMNKKVQGKIEKEDEKKEYFCGRCKSAFSVMAVLDQWSADGFVCLKCGFLLLHDPNRDSGGHEQSTRYHAQFRFITELLPKIDEVVIPENTFERALASARKVVRDDTNPANETAPVDMSAAKPMAVRGMANVGPTSISVTVTTSEGPTEADIVAEQARKEKIAAQNAMPVHFTHSTISGEQITFSAQPHSQAPQSVAPDKKNLDLDTPSINGDADIDDYFSHLKAVQAAEAAQEQEDEYETDDDDEEDLGSEGVFPTATGSGAATPVSSSGDVKPSAGPAGSGLSGVLKKTGSVSGSGTSTGATSPVTGPDTPNEDGPPTKKVRIAEEPTPKEEDESEEDMEFEDV